MESKNFLEQIQRKFNDAFKSQNSELFDVVFEIEGKKLYADKLRLSLISTTFKSMLSNRWISKNDAIKIETYKFDDFKEMLTFFYSGKCNITNENVFTILDMSEFYQIEDLKELCDEYLSKMELNLTYIFQLLEISNKYSLIQMKGPIQNFIFQNFSTFVESAGFLNIDKEIVKEIVLSELNVTVKAEEIFQAVYEWSENQAIKKQQLSIKRGFLFTYDKLSEILENVHTHVRVKITNLFGQSLYGKLERENNAVKVIKSLKNIFSHNGKSFVYWNTRCKFPSSPSLLKAKENVKWYLIYFCDGYIGIVQNTAGTHILTEMFSDSGEDFKVTDDCKIEID
uniref:BTB domain-containing protein n=1 Tax=Panagrolaimus davidi TaxID=227884 RepID=A0A914Q3Q6_9BILA